MLKNSFIFLKGFGYVKERRLWEQGILTWDDFLNTDRINGISKANKFKFDKMIEDAKSAFNNYDVDFFAKYFPKREFWRFYRWLKDYAIYFDIETDEFGRLLVISLYDGEFVRTFVRNFNLDFHVLRKILNDSKMLVTFNGSSFDIPILRRYVKIKGKIHFDLRPVFVRLGYNIGLKSIEKKFNIRRDEDIVDFRGKDALEFWKFFRTTGSRNALDLIIRYNQYDAVNLEKLAGISYDLMRKNIFRYEIPS